MTFNITHLKLSWSVSKGRDTYGYNICRLDDNNTGKRYKCNGGGYDMTGTVFGQWLQDTYIHEIMKLAPHARYINGNRVDGENGFYGLTQYCYADGTVKRNHLDGACGMESMLKIAEAIGLEVEREYVKKGRNKGQTIGWYVQMKAQ